MPMYIIFNTCDKEGKLVGVVALRSLVQNPRFTALADICEKDLVVANVNEDQELIANKIRKYDITALPILDDEGKLVGQVTYDDVMDVAEEEAAEDLYYMAGTNASELEEQSKTHAAFVRFAMAAGLHDRDNHQCGGDGYEQQGVCHRACLSGDADFRSHDGSHGR